MKQTKSTLELHIDVKITTTNQINTEFQRNQNQFSRQTSTGIDWQRWFIW